jgi:cytochrome c5
MLARMKVVWFCALMIAAASYGCSGSNGGDEPAGAAGSTAAGGTGGQGGSTPELPCAVQQVIAAKCERCHGDPLRNGAPVRIANWEDTQRNYGPRPLHEAMLEVVEIDFMPPVGLEASPPIEPLTDEEKETLVGWLKDGAAPVIGTTCP